MTELTVRPAGIMYFGVDPGPAIPDADSEAWTVFQPEGSIWVMIG